MPGFLLHMGATVLCAHGGQAMPTAPEPRVMVSGQPVATLAAPWVIAGCALPPPAAANGPCVTAQFMTSATRVLANGVPVLLLDSQALCTPTATPLMPVATQTRVNGV
ncbi:hypothetical protein FTO74_12610 [Granulicella sp. WH15]|uniref:hypothetical protein n=1 Tax=Granulicella sp. WH15 TaxID=2602070 RepID=UPI0013677C33|nr:hypothetical protein [Granulicella sp. WH15]QHN04118.1 hypothetical protein FTO74_12610 [Granulicella sp. WH15]